MLFRSRTVCGDLSYTVEEEKKDRHVIGNVAKDLGLAPQILSTRKARIDTEESSKRYVDVDLRGGDLVVAKTIPGNTC